MKTDELIAALARQEDVVDPRKPLRLLLGASLLGIAAALPLMLWSLGLNPSLASDARVPMFWVKWSFVAAVALTTLMLVIRLARPGAAMQWAARAVVSPFFAVWTLAVIVLLSAAPAERLPLVMGSSWNSCPLNIAMLSLPVLVLLLAVVRSLAPTRLRLAGTATGLLAGALATLAYLLHCPELEAPFVAVWYVIGMAIPAAIGALIGPRVLRW